MHRVAIGFGFFFTFLLSFLSFSHATSFVERPLVNIVREAEFIVRGQTGETYSDWARRNGRQIYSYTPLTISEVLKGKLSERESRILIRQPGGSKDGLEMQVPGAASFSHGEEVVVLLGKKNADDDSYEILGLSTGKYTVQKSEGQVFLINGLGGETELKQGEDAGKASYNTKFPYEKFKIVAEESLKLPPKEDLKNDKNYKIHSSGEDRSPNVAAQIQKEQVQQEPLSTQTQGSSNYWIIGSLVLLLILGGILFWLVAK